MSIADFIRPKDIFELLSLFCDHFSFNFSTCGGHKPSKTRLAMELARNCRKGTVARELLRENCRKATVARELSQIDFCSACSRRKFEKRWKWKKLKKNEQKVPTDVVVTLWRAAAKGPNHP